MHREAEGRPHGPQAEEIPLGQSEGSNVCTCVVHLLRESSCSSEDLPADASASADLLRGREVMAHLLDALIHLVGYVVPGSSSKRTDVRLGGDGILEDGDVLGGQGMHRRGQDHGMEGDCPGHEGVRSTSRLDRRVVRSEVELLLAVGIDVHDSDRQVDLVAAGRATLGRLPVHVFGF